MNKLLSIGQASKALGVTIQTLRNWDKKGLLKPDDMTKGGERRYKLETLKAINKNLVFNKDSLKTIVCEAKEVEVIIINKGEESVKFEEELAKDMLEIITVFSARLYGSRSKKNKKLLDEIQEVVVENVSK
ncbi:MerR family DNA-binding transcriptional regulator [Campylobacter jejuni]|nr:MerR family DNA-binding transcriptional regulator [Campylobacter jejuni]